MKRKTYVKILRQEFTRWRQRDITEKLMKLWTTQKWKLNVNKPLQLEKEMIFKMKNPDKTNLGEPVLRSCKSLFLPRKRQLCIKNK